MTSRARGRLSFNFAGFFYDPFAVSTAMPVNGLLHVIFVARQPALMMTAARPGIEFAVRQPGIEFAAAAPGMEFTSGQPGMDITGRV